MPERLRARVAVEAAHPNYWYRFVGLDGAVVGIERFGLSAPGAQAMEALGMTVDSVVAAVHRGIDAGRSRTMTVLAMTDLPLAGKRVLIREDLNVPIKNGVVTSDARIVAALPTLDVRSRRALR